MILNITSIGDLQNISGDLNERDPTTGNTILHKAFIKNFQKPLKKALLDLKIDVNIKNNLGQTVLYYCKSLDDVKILLKYGSVFTVRDIYNKTPAESNIYINELSTRNLGLF